MHNFPKKLLQKLEERNRNDSLRALPTSTNLVDFSSNDYLGMAKNKMVWGKAHELLAKRNIKHNGATGSRLLSGNYDLIEELESNLATFHQVETALLFNSGYDANVGLFSSVPQRGDLVCYDELIHASLRDGVQMGHAKSYKFKHNDLGDLDRLIAHSRNQGLDQEIYVVTESVFSMDGDRPDLKVLSSYCKAKGIHLIVDEAHATGIYGKGKGLVNELRLEKEVFARIVTFGKAMGCHGAAILGSEYLRNYLVNYARSFIYTTALPHHSIAAIIASFEHLEESGALERERLFKNIDYFDNKVVQLSLQDLFWENDSAIQCALIPNNTKVKRISAKLAESGFDVRPILSPTVPIGKERLRFCIHSYNSKEEIDQVLFLLKTFIDT